MNISTLIGFFLSFAIFIAAIVYSLDDVSGFLDIMSLLIVVGGTAATALVCFNLKKLLTLFTVFLKRMLGLNKKDYLKIIDEICELNDLFNNNKRDFETKLNTVEDPFLKEGASVLFWLEAEISDDRLEDLLVQKADTFLVRYADEANKFRTLSKFPPAFGMIGTVLGMIAVLQTLGDANAKDNIGPAMSIALITTLYGVAISNMVFVPIAENLTQQSKEDDAYRRLIVEGILLISADLPTLFVREKLKSFLLPSEREEDAQQKAA
jgi:chemotaxis protein MotA